MSTCCLFCASFGGLLINSILEFRTGNKLGQGGGRNLDFVAGCRVLACTSGTLGGFEGSKADQLNGIAILHRRLDRVDEAVQNRIGSGLGKIVLEGQGFNKLAIRIWLCFRPLNGSCHFGVKPDFSVPPAIAIEYNRIGF